MKGIRNIRIVLAVIFFMAAMLLMLQTVPSFGSLEIVRWLQIVPSALPVTLGVTLFWLAVTLLGGRFYCSCVCPIGTLTDSPLWLRRILPVKKKRFRFEPAKSVRLSVFWIYIVTLLLGQFTVAYLLEPWNIWRNIFSPLNPSVETETLLRIGAPAIVGFLAGMFSFAGLVIWGWRSGREFCTSICPIGTALGFVSQYSLYSIEIDPDRCVSCMKCEEECMCKCVKVVSRYVDNSRCVRCMECVHVCPEKAIRLTSNRHRFATPLFRKTKKIGSS